jgi:hypothetical protein
LYQQIDGHIFEESKKRLQQDDKVQDSKCYEERERVEHDCEVDNGDGSKRQEYEYADACVEDVKQQGK